ncbi:hypothetical protein ACHAXS_003254, partial [Conticribra weissflogii]
MKAIFAAFNLQEIACRTPAILESGCEGTTQTPPTLQATAGNMEVVLDWSDVGAHSYQVFRTEGVSGC